MVFGGIYQDPLTTLATAGPASTLPPIASFAALLPRPETQIRVLETVGASDTTLLFALQTLGLVGRGTSGKSDYVLTSVGTRLSGAQIHGDDVIAEEEHAPDYFTRFHRVTPDGTITLLRQKAQTRLTAVAMDSSNLAWSRLGRLALDTPACAARRHLERAAYRRPCDVSHHSEEGGRLGWRSAGATSDDDDCIQWHLRIFGDQRHLSYAVRRW